MHTKRIRMHLLGSIFMYNVNNMLDMGRMIPISRVPDLPRTKESRSIDPSQQPASIGWTAPPGLAMSYFLQLRQGNRSLPQLTKRRSARRPHTAPDPFREATVVSPNTLQPLQPQPRYVSSSLEYRRLC